jgi:hypothetical protein
VRYEDGALKGEIWVDIAKASELTELNGPELVAMMNRGEPIEVSTGIFFDIEDVAGNWDGEDYDYIARNMRPDHLALLPEGQGACSYKDGCGVRANKGEDKTLKDKDKKPTFEGLEAGQRELHQKIQQYLDGKDVRNEANPIYHYLIEVYEKSFVYRKEMSPEAKLYRQDYTIDNNEDIKFGEEVTEVQEKKEYVDVPENNKNKRKEGDAMANTDKCCPEKVKALIANEANSYTDDDKDWLEALTEEQLGKIETNVKTEDKGDGDKVKDEKITALKADNDRLKKDNDTLKANQKADEPKTLEDYLNTAPPEFKEMVQNGIGLVQEKKDTLVKEILANERNPYTEDQLKAMTVNVLTDLAKLAGTPSYVGNVAAITTDKIEVLELPKMETAKK